MSEFTKIKFCGMTRFKDVEMACELGIDALGFIFYPKSKRAVDIETALRISEPVPDTIDRYAVVVNPSEIWLKKLINDFRPTLIQFHGDETPKFCQQFDYPYIKAIAATNTESILEASHLYQSAKGLLLDTPSGCKYGGTGRTFDWTLFPEKHLKPYILAGGLTVENVVDAIKQINPHMVDCCSGVESEPGKKSESLMREFIKRIREE